MRITWGMAPFLIGAAFVAAAVSAADDKGKYSDLSRDSRPEMGPLAPRAAEAPSGTLTFYTSRAVFNAAHPGIPLETFVLTNLGPNQVMACPEPFNNMTNNGCFSPGDILPGIAVWNTTAIDLVVLTPPFFGVNCVAVGPNTFTDNGEMQFNPPVQAVGFDLLSNVAATYNIEVFGPGGSLGTTTAPGAIPGIFWGVDTSSPGGISRITTSNVGSAGELYCNVAFGQPVPVELQSFVVE
jgi:hypothetical protein